MSSIHSEMTDEEFDNEETPEKDTSPTKNWGKNSSSGKSVAIN